MPSDSIPLDPELVVKLRGQPRPFAARRLLGPGGPLAAVDAAFDRDTADVAYLLWLVFGHATRPGAMLAGRPSWEARDTLASRARAAAPCADTLSRYGHELLRRLRLRPESVWRDPDDLLWWRETCAQDGPSGLWRRMRRRERLEEAVVAMGLLRDWMFHLRGDAAPISETATPNTKYPL